MKIEIDTTAKTIKFDQKVNFGKMMTQIKK